MTWPDGFYVTYDYDVAGELTAIRENGAASGAGVLAAYAYDHMGRRSAVARGDGAASAYGYDGLSRLASLALNPAGTAHDQTWAFAYTPAGQIASRTRTNAAYDWTVAGASGTTSTVNTCEVRRAALALRA